jgi:hypothetical protein
VKVPFFANMKIHINVYCTRFESLQTSDPVFRSEMARFFVFADLVCHYAPIGVQKIKREIPDSQRNKSKEWIMAYVESLMALENLVSVQELGHLFSIYTESSQHMLEKEDLLKSMAELLSIKSVRKEMRSHEEDSDKLLSFGKQFLALPEFVQPSNREVAQSVLQIRGAILSMIEFHRKDIEMNLLIDLLERWAKKVQLALQDEFDFPTRLAAIRSIECFTESIQSMNQQQEEVFEAFLVNIISALYDALIDDDSEIRDLAAKIVSLTFGPGGSDSEYDFMSIFAQDVLFALLGKMTPAKPILLVEGLCRILGLPSDTRMMLVGCSNEATSTDILERIRTADEYFEEAMTQDTALFSREKQNLYKDEVQDAKRWSDLLSQTDAQSLNMILKEHICQWSIGGLQKLRDTAAKEKNSALGWAYKSEVYEVVFRILFMARVILEWNIVTQINGTESLKKLVLSLSKLDSCKLHPMWTFEIRTMAKKFFSEKSEV